MKPFDHHELFAALAAEKDAARKYQAACLEQALACIGALDPSPDTLKELLGAVLDYSEGVLALPNQPEWVEIVRDELGDAWATADTEMTIAEQRQRKDDLAKLRVFGGPVHCDWGKQ